MWVFMYSVCGTLQVYHGFSYLYIPPTGIPPIGIIWWYTVRALSYLHDIMSLYTPVLSTLTWIANVGVHDLCTLVGVK